MITKIKEAVFILGAGASAPYLTSTTPEQALIFRAGLRPKNPIYCALAFETKMHDACLCVASCPIPLKTTGFIGAALEVRICIDCNRLEG